MYPVIQLVITLLPVPEDATETERLFPCATETHALSSALVLSVHVIPSIEVITRLPDPEVATATNSTPVYVTETQSLSALVDLDVHVIP